MLIQHHRKRRGYVQHQLKVRAMVYGGTLILLCRSFIVPYTLSNNYVVRAYLKIKKNQYGGPIRYRDQFCITLPNFVEISHTVVEISQFFAFFSKM